MLLPMAPKTLGMPFQKSALKMLGTPSLLPAMDNGAPEKAMLLLGWTNGNTNRMGREQAAGLGTGVPAREHNLVDSSPPCRRSDNLESHSDHLIT